MKKNKWIIRFFVLLFVGALMVRWVHGIDRQKAHWVSNTIVIENSGVFEAELEKLRQLLKIPAFSVGIVRDQQLVWAKGFGFADLEEKVEATPGTPYHLASLTKPFAATIIMQLVEEETLSLDDPVSDYGVQLESTGIIRVKHLLSMTSRGNPGEDYHYDGSRYSLLSQVIEGATGKTFQELLAERILEPLGLKHTVPSRMGLAGFEGYDVSLVYEELASPYTLDQDYKVIGGQYPDHFSTAAGLISTVEDLAKFDAAMDKNLLVSPEAKATMFAPTISTDGSELPYGLGWHSQSYRDSDLVWHWGHWDSISTLILKVPDDSITFIILANTEYLSRPYDLGAGDVLRSPVALAFYKTFILEPQLGQSIPEVDWTASEGKIWSQLKAMQNEEVRDFLEKELLSIGLTYAALGHMEIVGRLLRVFLRVQFPWLYWIVISWLLLIPASLLFLIRDVVQGTLATWRMRIIWAMAMLFLGPISLLAYLISYREPLQTTEPTKSLTNLKCSLGSVVFSILGPAIGLLLAFILHFLIPTLGQTPPQLVAIFYGLPFLVGLLVFRTPTNMLLRKKGLLDGFRSALPVEMISSNLILLGMFPVTVITINWLNGFPIPDVSNPANPLFWLIFVSAMLISMVITYPAHFWMVKRQVVPWRELVTMSGTGKDTVIEDPSTSRITILLFVIVTYIVLFGVVFWLMSLM
jgi:CubicO group peptidase (beta-lactamase class C family)